MKRLLAWLVVVLCGIAPSAHAKSYLVSLSGLKLGDNEYVDTFDISTWGVGFEAVCHFPPGWTLTVGRTAALDGTLSGQASHGVAFLDREHLKELRGLVLVTFDGPIRRGPGRPGVGPPPTFAGSAHVGSYGDKGARTVAIEYMNVALKPSARCPGP
jgi:hypothetical protein